MYLYFLPWLCLYKLKQWQWLFVLLLAITKVPYLGGAQSCRVQSNRVPTYVLFLQVTLTTNIPAGQRKEEFLSCYTTDPVQRNDYAFWQNTKCAEAWKWCQRARQMWNCDGNIYPCCCGRVCWFKAAGLKKTVVQVDIVRPLSLSEASDWLIATKRLGWDSAAVSAAEPA